MIHHETTAGVINPLTDICDVIDRYNIENNVKVELLIDSMSWFGAYEVDMLGKHRAVSFLVSS